MPDVNLDEFLASHMRQGDRYVPGRLQAAMSLLERVREVQSLDLNAHRNPKSSGLRSHERYGYRVHVRLGLEAINKTHGRRSSDLGGWGQALLDIVRDSGFEQATPTARSKLLTAAQDRFGAILRDILDQEPLAVRANGRSAEAALRDVLRQAEAKGKAGEVAQYLVGAKLQLRLARPIPVVGYNKGDRSSHGDVNARSGDFEIANATIEVAMGLPDSKHIQQVLAALDDSDLEVWLLTRHDRVAVWLNELTKAAGVQIRRVVVAAVDAFVGQNISEMGDFSADGKSMQMGNLFALYNERWVEQVGTPGIRITLK